MYTPIGYFEAKASFSKLLQAVQKGQRFTITSRGLPIADLVPIKDAQQHNTLTAIEAMRSIQKARGISESEINDWISEGRL